MEKDNREIIFSILKFASKNTSYIEDILNKLEDKYSDVSSVLSAGYDSLMQIEGMGVNSAVLLSSIYPMISKAKSFDFERNKSFDNAERAGEYFINKYIGVKDETVYLLLLDGKKRFIDCVHIATGSVCESYIPKRKIAELALLKNAEYFIIAHNHPGGTVSPSVEDVTVTESLNAMAQSIGVCFLEHILVADSDYIPLMLYVDSERGSTYSEFYTESLVRSVRYKKNVYRF